MFTDQFKIMQLIVYFSFFRILLYLL